jgi:FXSXX-COOH protein
VDNLSSVVPPAVTPPGEAPSAGIPDLRAVPLGELSRDAHASRLVSEVLASLEGPSRIMVATFNSAI